MRISYITATEWAESRRRFLLEAEESLAAQTLSDIEWIIVSANPAPGWLAGLVKTTCIHLPDVPWGQTHLLNRGIEVAQGEYLAFMDDDNRKMPTFGEEMIRFIEAEGAEAVYCFAKVIDENSQVIGNHHVSTADYDFAWETPGIYFNDELLVKREAMESLGGFDLELHCGEDYDLAFRLLRDKRVALFPTRVVDLRVHADQWTKKDASSFLQIALHQILAKHGRLNANCAICGALLEGKPYAETHICWTDLGSHFAYQRVCVHPAVHP